MNPLQLRLASLRRHLYMVTLWRGLCAIFALVVGSALVVGWTDWYVNLPSVIRAFFLVGIVGSAGYVFLRHICMPLAGRSDDLSLALRIEEVYPELNDALASTVQFLEEPEKGNHSSPALRKQAIEQAMKLADDCDFNRILDRRGVWLLGLGAFITAVLGWYFYFGYGALSQTALLRLADPFGGHTWTQLNIPNCPPRIAQGQPFVLKGELSGIIPALAHLEVDGRMDKIIAIKKDADHQTGILVAPFDVTNQKGKFRFRILANDAVFPGPGLWQEVQILPPPRLIALDGMPSPQLELRFPEYTDLPSPRKLSPGQGNVENAVAGTHVTLRAAVDRPVTDAWIELLPDKATHKYAALLGPLGHSQPLDMLGLTCLGHAVAGRISCQIDNGGTLLSVRFLPWLPGHYALHFHDSDGLANNDYKQELRIFTDPPPAIHLQQPASSQTLLPDARVTFKMMVEDETFAVRSVFLEYRRKNAEGKWLDQEPQSLPILDHDMMSRDVPHLLATLARAWPTGATLRLRPRQVELNTHWPLRGTFKEGEIVVLQICADDFNNLLEPRAVGRSHEIELRIVAKGELAKQLDEDFAKIQQELVRLQHMQEEALKHVEDVQKNKDKPGAKTSHDKLVEAEQIQRQIQERIGQRKEEGLRQELANLQNKMRDNQLPPSDMQDRLRTLATELDRLARENLQQIEAKLSEARKEMAGTAKPAPKNKDPLKEAQSHQEDAKKTLDELAKFLDPWANMHQIKGRTRDLLTKQKELKKETDALLPQQNEIPKNEDLKGELSKKADTQNNLAQEAQDLLDMMNKVQEKQKDSDTGKKVANAAKVAENAGLADKMRQARDDLRQPKLNEASQKQKEAIDNLEKVLAALEEERRDDELDKLRKKQKQAEEKIEQIAKDMDKLQKKVKEVNKIADPRERAEELKKLGKEQEKLQEEAQELARELARLRAEKASREMARAAQDLERAGRKLEAGEDPEDIQEEAVQRLKDAKAKLEEAEEELAREQLARIADNIKGLKERQDAAVAESERIHKELQRQGRWTSGLLSSLKGSGKTQKGLQQEAESLKEKLKDAKVFEHILGKAGETMDQAVITINERAEDKAFNPLEKDELADENKYQEKTLKLQKLAAHRLQRLHDALKNDPALAQKNELDREENAQPKGAEEENQGGMKLRGGDGIPPLAQLKALRDEQTDIKERTKEFNERHPDVNQLNEEQQAELNQLSQEQSDIRTLFNQVLNAKGNEP
jgi:hypothetical protein